MGDDRLRFCYWCGGRVGECGAECEARRWFAGLRFKPRPEGKPSS